MSVSENIKNLKENLPENVTMVAVSKTKPVTAIMEAYRAGQLVFGENKIQELEAKWQELPKDIQWHMIGHVQTNKVKYIAPFVSLIHAVDSLKLLKEIDKQAKKNNRVISCLLQIKIAAEESKFGLDETAARSLLVSEEAQNLQHVKIVGLMGMATFTENMDQVAEEFGCLKSVYDKFRIQSRKLSGSEFRILSMGMSGDYQLAMGQGSTMIRIGSAIFGEREVNQ